VDGAQRIQTLEEFVNGDLRLESLEKLPALNGFSFDAVAPVLRYVPAPVLSAMGSKGPSLDAQASNVRGYDDPTYLAGAQLVDTYWFGPLLGVAVMAVMYSQAGTCHIGVHADTAAVADGDAFARCLREGFDEVVAARRPASAVRKAKKT
jgi:hypothetical protein